MIRMVLLMIMACALLSGIAAADINQQVAQINIGTSTIDDVIRIFGQPREYLWGGKTFTKANLPSVYIADYPNKLRVVISKGNVDEIRFEGPESGYVFLGKIRIGSSLQEVLPVVGLPIETIENKPNDWKDRILYKDIDGRKGHCYYSCSDQGVRFFFGDYKVAAIYLISKDLNAGGTGNDSFQTVRPISSVAEFQDVRWKDMTMLNLTGRKALISTLNFNQKTVWPDSAHMPVGCDPNKILIDAMNPGLGIRELHEDGITGKGVNVAIIDQPLYTDHPEFEGKIAEYHDVGCTTQSSMHGPAVTSLLVGTYCGTAPDARVVYVATPSGTKDAAFYSKALDWIVEQNKHLSDANKIRVVSVSAAPSGQGSQFDKNNKMWDDACVRAEAAGLLVLDCTQHHGFIGSCWYNAKMPEKVVQCTPGFPGRTFLRRRSGFILVPTSPRTVAEEYDKGQFSYQYCGRGGLSWAIPYCAGVLAMGWQINPDLSADQMKQLLLETAYIAPNGSKIINPAKFIDAVKKTRNNS